MGAWGTDGRVWSFQPRAERRPRGPPGWFGTDASPLTDGRRGPLRLSRPFSVFRGRSLPAPACSGTGLRWEDPVSCPHPEAGELGAGRAAGRSAPLRAWQALGRARLLSVAEAPPAQRAPAAAPPAPCCRRIVSSPLGSSSRVHAEVRLIPQERGPSVAVPHSPRGPFPPTLLLTGVGRRLPSGPHLALPVLGLRVCRRCRWPGSQLGATGAGRAGPRCPAGPASRRSTGAGPRRPGNWRLPSFYSTSVK